MKVNTKIYKGSFINLAIWLLLFITCNNFVLMGMFPSSDNERETVVEDMYMTTTAYHTEIRVQEDNSYLVSEDIHVEFQNSRHGIYRYIPRKGIITEVKEDGNIEDIPYYARFDKKKQKASAPVDVTIENGNKVFRLGDPDESVYGAQEYQLQYEVTPVTSKGYDNAYYNIFPTGWQNEIPKGSTFSITFPKKVNKDSLQIYYGRYGEQMNAKDIIDFTWNGNTISGSLTQALPVGTGMTFYIPLEAGYFTGVSTMRLPNLILVLCAVFALIIMLSMYFFFGKDKPIIPSIQYQPPKGLDSAAAGYIVDGNASDTDTISLLLYWADQGYLKVREQEETLSFEKVKELPKESPRYAKTLFKGIFGKDAPVGKVVFVSDLEGKTAKTFSKAREQIERVYFHRIYTKNSRIARIVSLFLSCIPLFGVVFCLINYTVTNWLVFLLPVLYWWGLILFNRTVDYWYSSAKKSRLIWGSASAAMSVTSVIALLLIYGIGMLQGRIINLFPGLIAVAVTSLAGLVLTGFMKKRTDECIEWMGYLAGLRDFIETAELERMKVIAQESPQLFYHILPFAYVFGLTDILLDKMKMLTLPTPDWYETEEGRINYSNYYLLHRVVHTNLEQIKTSITFTPQPVVSSSGTSGSSGGGYSGGGFSGGGFGGGGGGSW